MEFKYLGTSVWLDKLGFNAGKTYEVFYRGTDYGLETCIRSEWGSIIPIIVDKKPYYRYYNHFIKLER